MDGFVGSVIGGIYLREGWWSGLFEVEDGLSGFGGLGCVNVWKGGMLYGIWIELYIL